MEGDNTAVLKLSGGKQAIISIRQRGDRIGLKVKGDQIRAVTPGSPADQAELSAGQTITSVIDERNITSIKDYKKAIKDFSKHQQPITFRAIELSGVKIAAVKALGRLADEEGFNRLIELIQGSEDELREPATTALKELVLETQKGKSTDLRQKINDGQVETLAKKYMQRENEPNPEIRRSYLSILGVLQPASAIQGLIEVVQDEEEQPGIRFKAGSTLSQIGREAVDPLVAAYQAGNLSVKDITASALGKIGSNKAKKMLISALKAEQNPTIQLTLADAVARFKDADSRRVLANLRSGLQESSGLRMFLDELLNSPTVVEDMDKGTIKPELGNVDDFDTL
jgi:HEAT repeat protein